MTLDILRKHLPVTDFDVEGTPDSWAVFTKDRALRLGLGRAWTPELGQPRNKLAIFCGLNPSSAGAFKSDVTITKEIGFSTRLGCSSLLKVNLYPWISTDPLGLERPGATLVTLDSVVEDIVIASIHGPFVVIAAWGSSPWATEERIAKLRLMLPGPLHCLGRTRGGAPRHPSRLAYATPLEAWP